MTDEGKVGIRQNWTILQLLLSKTNHVANLESN
jgi:hypothetical protein